MLCRSWKFDQYPRSTAHYPLIKIRDRTIPSGRSWICRTRKELNSMSFLLRCIIVASVVCAARAYTRGHCQPVPDFCRNLTNGAGYAYMRLPNAFNYQLKETVEAINPWKLLVGRCHPGLKLFLCAIYAPICLEDKESGLQVSIKLCKSFCFKVKDSCERVMNRNNYTWPTHHAFNCSQYVDDSMCVREDFISSTTTQPPLPAGTLLNERLDRIRVKQFNASLGRRRQNKHSSGWGVVERKNHAVAVDKPRIFIARATER